MAKQSRIEDAQVKRQFTFTKDGTSYRVFETAPKRTVDVFRFELWKTGSMKPYVVAFQDTYGRSGSCSCPAGLYHRSKGECKHVKMCRMEFLTDSRPAATPTRSAPTRAAKVLPAHVAQMNFRGMDEVEELASKLKALRAQYKAKKAELDGIEREGNLIKARLETLRKRRAA